MSYSELIARVKPGRPPHFKSPEDLWERALEYFAWEDKEVINEVKGVGYQGEYSLQDIPHSPPYTLHGLCIYSNITTTGLREYKKRPEFSRIIELIEEIIYKHKYKGAVVGLYNANIIARDLGLKDRTDITTDDEPLQTNVDENLELARKIAFALRTTKEQIEESPDKSTGENPEQQE